MTITKPHYYDSFRCLASACPDSCCREWDIQVDEDAAAMYRSLPGPLGDRLRAVLTEEDGDTVMSIENGRCPMWREDGLCRIQAELGEKALCKTCRDFPRLRHDYGDFVELGLELSCPEAARLILTASGCETVTQQLPGGGEPGYDRDAMAVLKASRIMAFSILEDRTLGAGEALAVLLLYACAVQEALDGGEIGALSRTAALDEARSLAQPGKMEDILALYQTLEILTPRWREALNAGPKDTPWEDVHRALARYFVGRYWFQAVADYDLTCRVKFIVTSCLVIKALGGDILQTAQLYSKEIENDADNVDALLDGTYSSPALADVKLLGLLLAA